MTRVNFYDLPLAVKKQVVQKLTDEEKQSLNVPAEEIFDRPKKSKYKSSKVTVDLGDGTTHTFDSSKEARRYEELKILEKSGEIKELKMQVPYELIPNQKKSDGKTERAIKYVADFVYEQDGKTIVEDVKGYKGGGAYAVFTIKRKLMLWIHGIEVKEV